MKCIKKNYYCKPSICFKAKGNNFICSGISKKPSKFKEDIVWLCGKGKVAKFDLEMTKSEALALISVLTGSLFSLNQ